jgi:hypothetical protein
MARRPATTNGHTITRIPGAYVCVLQKRCAEELYDGSWALTDVTSEQSEAYERDYRERVAALVERRRRAGEPVNAQSCDLPPGLPAPFENWPRGGQRFFSVASDDTIKLKLRLEVVP